MNKWMSRQIVFKLAYEYFKGQIIDCITQKLMFFSLPRVSLLSVRLFSRQAKASE